MRAARGGGGGDRACLLEQQKEAVALDVRGDVIGEHGVDVVDAMGADDGTTLVNGSAAILVSGYS